LADWRRNSWLVEHTSSREEIAGLLAVVDRDLANATVAGLSPDWRFSIAYNAALQAATAALAAAGFRAAREQHHYRTVQSLSLTIGWSAELVSRLDRVRKKRNIAGYETAGAISAHEADHAHELAQRLAADVRRWLISTHPKLLK
jgi:hypothetical protein